MGGMEKQIPFRIPNAAFRKISIPHSRMGAQLYPFVRSCRNAGGAIIHSECSTPKKISVSVYRLTRFSILTRSTGASLDLGSGADDCKEKS